MGNNKDTMVPFGSIVLVSFGSPRKVSSPFRSNLNQENSGFCTSMKTFNSIGSGGERVMFNGDRAVMFGAPTRSLRL